MMIVSSQGLYIFTSIRYKVYQKPERDPQIQPLDLTIPVEHFNSSNPTNTPLNLSLIINRLWQIPYSLVKTPPLREIY